MPELTSVWIWVLELPHLIFNLLEHGCNPSRVPDIPILLKEDADLDGLRGILSGICRAVGSRISELTYGHRCRASASQSGPTLG